MKEIKKQAASLVIAALAVTMPMASHAAFTAGNKVTNTAIATLAGTGVVTFNPTIRVIASGAVDTAINWTGVTLPSAFVLASDYIQLDSTITASGGGIQTYTDNVNGTPKFTGDATTETPAGLVDSTDTTKVLPIAWRIVDSTVTVTALSPNNTTDPNHFLWLYLEDKSQVAIPSLNAGAFANGIPFVTVKNSQGIHFAQGDTQFGAASTSNKLYLEADFSSALTPRTYSTSTYTLEAYTE